VAPSHFKRIPSASGSLRQPLGFIDLKITYTINAKVSSAKHHHYATQMKKASDRFMFYRHLKPSIN
jgi:hypothetical protein